MSKLEQFSWSQELSVGVNSMDDQHKILIDKINTLINSLNEDRSSSLEEFDQLASFVVQHFKDEEQFMEEVSFSGLEGHKLIHQNLLETVGEFRSQFEDKSLDKLKLVNFLKFWLKSHIMGIDAKYGQFANEITKAG